MKSIHSLILLISLSTISAIAMEQKIEQATLKANKSQEKTEAFLKRSPLVQKARDRDKTQQRNKDRKNKARFLSDY